MRTFRLIIANTLAASVTNSFVWFAMTFWLYLQTQSVLATSLVGGSFMAAMAVSGFWLGSIVDHHKKKTAMLLSSITTLACFIGAFALLTVTPDAAFASLASPAVWLLVLLILLGVLAGNIRTIALPTLVTMLVSEKKRAQANGLTGIVMGVSSIAAGIMSGFILGYAGMEWVMLIGIACTLFCIAHLLTLRIRERGIVHLEEHDAKKVDIKGTIKLIRNIPGLFALIFFTTFNNFLGGVFLALMDPYGLSLLPVQAWGTLWGILSSGLIVGALLIARFGLGDNPVRTLLRFNIVTWSSCIFFVLQPSVLLLSLGVITWVICAPFIEAAEHTVLQRVVPLRRQGRVFGFAQSVETSASPLTAFLIGPIAQFVFIPFMTTGRGVELIGSWFGTGQGRGIALVFILSGFIGLAVTLFATRSRSFLILSDSYAQHEPDAIVEPDYSSAEPA